MTLLCIYHGLCDDGFAAAWAVRHAMGKDVEFFPGIYQKAPPDVTGRDVLLVDFSYKEPVLLEMVEKSRSLLILDHHKTAQKDLEFLPELHRDDTLRDWNESGLTAAALFDMERSGAMIAWDFFHGGKNQPVPRFIEYVQDRDLWRKQLPYGDKFTIALRSYPQDFAVWDGLIDRGPDALIAEGHAIQRYYRLRVEELKRSAYLASIVLPGTAGPAPADVGITVQCAMANAPYFAASEVAGELCDMRGAEFGACYFEVSPGQWQYSLRSRGEFDVSAIALQFGGGGHKGAAGFTVPEPIHTPWVRKAPS